MESFSSGPTYSAPALEKGLDILELLCRSNKPLSQTEIAGALDRSINEIYRMLACLVNRKYVSNIGEVYSITTKLFELSHINPPTYRLLTEAAPIMQELSDELEQSCHMTIYNLGRQVVIAKIDSPIGMGWSLRVGAALDMLISASGRVLLAFQDPEITRLRVKESIQRRPEHAHIDITTILEAVRARGFESMASLQLDGLHAVSFPIFDTQDHAFAALTVPYAKRLDQREQKTISDVEAALGKVARLLSSRIGGRRASGNGSAEPSTPNQDPAAASGTPKRARRVSQGLERHRGITARAAPST